MAASQTVWPPLSAAKLHLARRLLTAKGRDVEGAFLAEGPQVVREALGFGAVAFVIVAEGRTPPAKSLAVDAALAGLPVFMATDAQMAQITDTVRGQGVVAVCRRLEVGLKDLEGKLFLVLDEVRDPGNVGTLIRTADAFGVGGVIATTGTAEIHAPKVVRASVGSVFHLPVAQGVAFEDAVSWARGQGLALLGADAHGDPLTGVTGLWRPTVWVVGNEAHGVPDAHLRMLDSTVSVPMWGRAESLNVATAAAICLWESAVAQARSVEG
ncbi:MAG: RNA methyltransferase [Propionibacteriaceae bacterium]|nr:RNA methyltransferase [Propionibacteriaceae bacterium]